LRPAMASRRSASFLGKRLQTRLWTALRTARRPGWFVSGPPLVLPASWFFASATKNPCDHAAPTPRRLASFPMFLRQPCASSLDLHWNFPARSALALGRRHDV